MLLFITAKCKGICPRALPIVKSAFFLRSCFVVLCLFVPANLSFADVQEPAIGSNGMVVSQEYFASEAGLEILKDYMI